MVFFDPVQGVCNEEILYFILPVVEDFGPPVGMFPFPGICIFIQGLSVKISQAMGIPREMGGHPVQDHADPLLMEIVDKVHKFVRRAVTGGGSVVTGHLISPGAVERMLRDPHQLYVGVTHIGNVFGQLFCRLFICIKTVFFLPVFLFPGTDVNLVNA